MIYNWTNHTFILLLGFLIVVVKSKSKKFQPPLIEDDIAPVRNPTTECLFGDQIRLINTTWTPDLGPPFGKMYCERCECRPIKRKKKVIAVVHCYNFKHECPEPICDNPIRLPHECCKKCPNDIDLNNIMLPSQTQLDTDTKSCHHNGQVYQNSIQWISKSDPCQQCYCDNGNVLCNVISCPRLHCLHNESIEYSANQCCPSCKNRSNNKLYGCHFGDNFYSAGSKWHPFMVPIGYDNCTTCNCDKYTFKVKCFRIDCELHCNELVPNFALLSQEEKQCCSQCPKQTLERNTNPNNNTMQMDESFIFRIRPRKRFIYNPRQFYAKIHTQNNRMRLARTFINTNYNYDKIATTAAVTSNHNNTRKSHNDTLLNNTNGCKSPNGLIIRDGSKYHPVLYNHIERSIVCLCVKSVLTCQQDTMRNIKKPKKKSFGFRKKRLKF